MSQTSKYSLQIITEGMRLAEQFEIVIIIEKFPLGLKVLITCFATKQNNFQLKD